MALIHLSNDFHNSTAKIQAAFGWPLTRSQIERARRKLCGVRGCKCSDNRLGTRGHQGFEIDDDGVNVTLRSLRD